MIQEIDLNQCNTISLALRWPWNFAYSLLARKPSLSENHEVCLMWYTARLWSGPSGIRNTAVRQCVDSQAGGGVSQELMKYRSREIGSSNNDIALEFDSRLNSIAESPAKFYSDWENLNPDFAFARLCEILQ